MTPTMAMRRTISPLLAGFGFHLLAGLILVVVRWPPRRYLVAILVFTTLANAAATGALANVYDRLQARVTWLLPFAALMLLVREWPTFRRTHGTSTTLRP